MVENGLNHMPFERRDAFAPSLALSLILHLLFFGIWNLSAHPPRYAIARASSSMEIVLVEASSFSDQQPEPRESPSLEASRMEEVTVPGFSEETTARDQSRKMNNALPPVVKPYNRISPGAATQAKPLGGITNPAPVYPALARKQGWEGTVVVRVHVQGDGLPGQVLVEKSSGHKVLDSAASETIRQWKFKPAQTASRAQDSWVTIPVQFALVGE